MQSTNSPVLVSLTGSIMHVTTPIYWRLRWTTPISTWTPAQQMRRRLRFSPRHTCLLYFRANIYSCFYFTYPLPSSPRLPLSRHARAPFALHFSTIDRRFRPNLRHVCSDPTNQPYFCSVFVVAPPHSQPSRYPIPRSQNAPPALPCLTYHASTPSLRTFFCLMLRITSLLV